MAYVTSKFFEYHNLLVFFSFNCYSCSSNEGYYRSSLFSTMPQVTDSTVTSSATNESSLPPPPPSSNTNNDKSALWSDIHKGKMLRPTVTDDRSAPLI